MEFQLEKKTTLATYVVAEESIASIIASLIRYEYVIPAKAGIQKNTGFRVKPGMTEICKFMLLCIITEMHVEAD